MKLQDAVFLLVFAFLLYKRSPRRAVIAGLASLILSIPLFSFWIFFTAERLVYYGAGFLLLSIIFLIKDIYADRN
ncbi:hypothetical protein M1615_03940 [Patescibacteria group bacterium]|nr:hypothetical protein [Patescibacteria group bacterium]